MGTNWKKLTENAASRSHIYGLLATIFRAEPSAALVHELRGPQISEVLDEMDVELGEGFHHAPPPLVADALAEEFTRLFIGPGRHISAHESVFAEVDGGCGSLWGRSTVEVKRFIEATGLVYDPEFSGLPDHASVELELMQRLAEWEAERWRSRDRITAEYCLDVQRRFLDEHLLAWMPGFCDAVIAEAEIPFYRSMAVLCKNFLQIERAGFPAEAVA